MLKTTKCGDETDEIIQELWNIMKRLSSLKISESELCKTTEDDEESTIHRDNAQFIENVVVMLKDADYELQNCK